MENYFFDEEGDLIRNYEDYLYSLLILNLSHNDLFFAILSWLKHEIDIISCDYSEYHIKSPMDKNYLDRYTMLHNQLTDIMKVPEYEFKKDFDVSIASANSDAECPICCESSADAELIECGHLYHKTCILKWMKVSKSCPMCRKCALKANKLNNRQRSKFLIWCHFNGIELRKGPIDRTNNS